MTSVWCDHHHWANSEAQHGPSAVPPVPPSSPKCSSPDSQQPPDPGWLNTFNPNTSSSEFYPFSRTLAQSAPHTDLPVPPSLGIHSILDLPATHHCEWDCCCCGKGLSKESNEGRGEEEGEQAGFSTPWWGGHDGEQQGIMTSWLPGSGGVRVSLC